MKTVLIMNPKGGVGKSLIADELAFSLERSGIPYSFYDLCGQGGTIHETNKNPKAKARIVDTAAGIIKETKDFINDADLIVIPTRMTSRDIEALDRIRDIVKKNSKCPVVFVMNCYDESCSKFMEYFNTSFKEEVVYKLPQSKNFVEASSSMVSVVEMDESSEAANSIQELCNGIIKEIGLENEGNDAKQVNHHTKQNIHRVTIAVNDSYYWKIKKVAIRRKTTVTKLILDYIDSF